MKHKPTVLLTFLIVLVVLAAPTSVQAEAVSPCPPTTAGRWYKVASLTQDDFNGLSGPHNPVIPNQMIPEPGMPQALGFETWQALYDDIMAVDGEIAEIGLHYIGTANNHPVGAYLARHPAHPGLLPEGQPSSASAPEWIYFAWDVPRNPITSNLGYVRFQHDPGGPLLLFDFGINAGWVGPNLLVVGQDVGITLPSSQQLC